MKRVKSFIKSLLTLCVIVLGSLLNATPKLDDLLHDMQHYKTTSRHRGNLYEHSIWAEQYISRWAIEDCRESFWLRGISERNRYLLAVTCLLHDIGKAGAIDDSFYEAYERVDEVIYYYTRYKHERIGFEYIMHDLHPELDCYRQYCLFDGCTIVDMKSILESLSIDDREEQHLVAFLIGTHKLFTSMLNQIADKYSWRIDYQSFWQTVTSLADESTCPLTQELIEMMLAIGIADYHATFYPLESPTVSLVLGNPIYCVSPHPFINEQARIDRYSRLVFPVARYLRMKLLNQFNSQMYQQGVGISQNKIMFLLQCAGMLINEWLPTINFTLIHGHQKTAQDQVA